MIWRMAGCLLVDMYASYARLVHIQTDLCLSVPPMTAIIDMIIMIVPVKVFMRLTEEWDRDSIQARWRSSSYG
jgi:hypothetical protein